MARYLLVEDVDRPRGSIEGATFQRCGKVFAIRKHNVPTDKKRIDQTGCRNKFEHVQTRFRDLSAIEKESFADEAINYPRTDSLGNEYIISAINLQNSSNTNLLNAGQSEINSMPGPVVFPPFTIATLQLSTGLSQYNIITDPNPVPAGFDLLIYASIPSSPGVAGVSNVYKLLGVVSAGINTSDIDHFQSYVQLFGDLSNQVGRRVFVLLRYLSIATGQVSLNVIGDSLIE